MDKYFSSVASLISMLMRHVVENSIKDLTKLFKLYLNGNKYEPPYTFFEGLALPHLVIPFTFYFLPSRESESLTMSSDFEETKKSLNEIVDLIVYSLNDLPRIEYLLFDTTNICIPKYNNLVAKDEDIVLNCKELIKKVIHQNSFGPEL